MRASILETVNCAREHLIAPLHSRCSLPSEQQKVVVVVVGGGGKRARIWYHYGSARLQQIGAQISAALVATL